MSEKNSPLAGAQWVFCRGAQPVNSYAEILDFFTAEGDAKVRICAGREYVLYINGQFVNCGQYESFPGNWYYDELEIGSFLRPGVNSLAVLCFVLRRKGNEGVIYEVEQGGKVIHRSGPGALARVSRTYRSGDTDMIGNGKYFVAHCTPCEDWIRSGTDGFSAAECSAADAVFQPRPVDKCEIFSVPSHICAQGLYVADEEASLSKTLFHSYLSARRLADLCGGQCNGSLPCGGAEFRHAGEEGMYLVVDLGEEKTGYLHLDLETERPLAVRYCFGEHLEDLRVRCDVRNYAGEICFPAGRTDFTDYVQRLGLRYLMLFIGGNAFRLYDAGIRECRYPLQVLPFHATDALAQAIYDTSLHTLRCCMHSHYEDCPHREQYQYAMDTRTQMLCGYYAFGEYRFARAALLQMGEALDERGNLFLVTPERTGPAIPMFTLVYLQALKEYTEYSGDDSVFALRRQTAEQIVNGYYSRIDGETGLLPQQETEAVWNFYGWSDGLINKWGDNPQPEGTVLYAMPLQCHLVQALGNLAWLYRRAGEDKKAEEMEARAAALRRSADEKFFDAARGRYATYRRADGTLFHECELSQVLALYTGVASGEHADRIYRILLTEEGDLALNDRIFKYDALLTREEGVEYVRRDILARWGKMLFAGATTFWETEKGPNDFNFAASLCHGWSAIPAYIFRKYRLFTE